jgi:hypothetical protein
MQVIDECHHADNMHPYNEILEHYRQQPVQQQAGTQVMHRRAMWNAATEVVSMKQVVFQT